jgi:hypothetical protein
MPSGERIQFGPNVNFVFETHDLSCASPATISRMGMIFLSDEDTDVKALISTWLSSQPEADQGMLSGWIEDHFHKALAWVLKQVMYCKSYLFCGPYSITSDYGSAYIYLCSTCAVPFAAITHHGQ